MKFNFTSMRNFAITRGSALVLVWIITAESFLRGVDYVLGDGPNVTQSLTFIETVAPLWFWGLLGLVVCALTSLGLIWGKYEPLIVGASLGVALYFTFAIGLAVVVYERGWPPDGYRTPGMFVAYAGIWLILTVEAFINRDATRVILEDGNDTDTGDAS